MEVKFPDDVRIFIACGQTDMRKSIDGLTAIVSQIYKLDPFQNALYLFCGRRRDRVKALYWEGDGFLLFYKRLENGSFQWPRTNDEAREITPQQYRWLLKGLSVDQKKVIQNIESKRIL
ncbi:IS66 family insertion sequence element accessory protein TnpB [Proteiniclasticum ruminis]|uniref:Transposase n=1 Tax=Proteiniclasticum ruminis TaxID=398199 RepID=A0A1G8JPG0_9CLOT|nr:IS66 family insertion sequence element accessory protein TnpB [Proteiniclasticum ruminis]SDI33076.1 transposase [Proteiniclasticum ruminis]